MYDIRSKHIANMGGGWVGVSVKHIANVGGGGVGVSVKRNVVFRARLLSHMTRTSSTSD